MFTLWKLVSGAYVPLSSDYVSMNAAGDIEIDTASSHRDMFYIGAEYTDSSAVEVYLPFRINIVCQGLLGSAKVGSGATYYQTVGDEPMILNINDYFDNGCAILKCFIYSR